METLVDVEVAEERAARADDGTAIDCMVCGKTHHPGTDDDPGCDDD